VRVHVAADRADLSTTALEDIRQTADNTRGGAPTDSMNDSRFMQQNEDTIHGHNANTVGYAITNHPMLQ
jgi:hypothetical protein